MLYSIFVIYVLPLGIAAFVLYFVMRAAVNSVLDEKEVQRKKDFQKEKDKADIAELIKLRDMGLLGDEELEEVIEIYAAEKADAENREQYQRCLRILNELKEREYFTDEQLAEKSNRLKEQFNVD